MSKVKYYLDSKQKALHRQRRYETAHKKFSRARSYEKGEYFYWGYFVTRQRERVRYTWVKTPRGTSICIPDFEKIGGKSLLSAASAGTQNISRELPPRNGANRNTATSLLRIRAARTKKTTIFPGHYFNGLTKVGPFTFSFIRTTKTLITF